jgi:hypothetical protein
MDTPAFAMDAAGRWQALTRWERAEIGRGLRRLGWTYGEIMDVIPVGKGTLAGWCRDIRLTDGQIEAIKARVPSQIGVPKDTNWKRRLEIDAIRQQAKSEVTRLMEDPLWVAGVVLYWAEGSKTRSDLSIVNADPAALRLFIGWVRCYLDRRADFCLSLHLHEGNNESAAKAYWRHATTLTDAPFTKTFIKPRGTGHRKNHLPHGVCRVRVRRSSNARNRGYGLDKCHFGRACPATWYS